jgi:hypothetical protein
MRWSYIACDIKNLPEDVYKSCKELNNYEIHQIINNIPIIEGEMIAANVETVIRLLLHKNLYPLKLHLNNKVDKRIRNLKKLINIKET